MNSSTLKFLFNICIGLVITEPVLGQDFSVPLEMQLILLPKVLVFEKNLAARNETIKIGILIDESNPLSGKIKSVLENVKQVVKSEQNIPFDFREININENFNIERNLLNPKPDAIYFSQINKNTAFRVSKFCKDHNIISFSGLAEHRELELTVFFDLADKKLKLLIDLNSARAEGANFSSRLLRLATIINE